ncbi:MAG: tRNA dihydrouridine(20/20a) synthase DusA, partial [Pseudomonadales bacterium]
MMDWTDRHCRYFHRLLCRNALLYTEMVTTGALLYGDTERFLRFDRHEHPIALQLGGSNPKDLAACAQLAESHGYDEVNLNCGCPSDRVQNGSFGACLMQEPELVANCVRAMQSVCNIPVTVKCRIGIDDQDEETALQIFAEHLVDAGCRSLT